MVPGAGIEPALLSEGDFESLGDPMMGVACSLVLGAMNHRLKAFLYSYGN